MVVVAYSVLLFLLIIQLVLAQPGFVNIQNCATSEYTDPLTSITYKTDGYLFNNIGTCIEFSSQSSRFFGKDRNHRWCYNLPIIKGQNYIARFTFLNISSLKEVDFKVSIDTTTISHINSYTGSVVEGAFVATRNYTNLCLLKGSGNAYISKIELRPLYDSSYLTGNTSLLLKLISRVDLGNKDFVYRYPTDSADRIWSIDPNSSKSNLKSDNIFHHNANISIPLEILQTASSDNEKLQFIQSIHNDNDTKSFDDYLIILHLFELIPNVKPGERVFDIYLNGEQKFEKIDILQTGGDSKYRDIVTKIRANRYVNISLVMVSGSKYGPICNAYEIFKVYQKATETKQLDLDALSKLHEQLVVENPENVMYEKLHGDPCMCPPWKGLACKEKNGEFVITKLDFTLMKMHGPLPSAIDDLANLESIRCNPNISCQLPNGLSYSNAITIESVGAPSEPESNHHVIGTVAGGSVAFSIALGMIFTCFYKCSRPNRKEPPIMKNVVISESNLGSSSMTPSIKSFTLHSIQKATCHYSTLIGEGGFGAVYRGTLQNDEEVAVKVRSATSTQGTREFNNEVTLLSEIRHDNLVPLLGYCSEKDQQILVYPFMSNGSLQDRLYGEASKRKVLDWATRLSIALDAAKGLAYLHSFGGRCIIHRDVKSSNILLDQFMSGKVADFGFSKYAPQEGDSAVSLEVRGTAGYLDPEYYSTQQLSAKSDVFSFGVVLLEIITGREPLNIHRPRDEWSLVEWAKPYIRESKIEEIVDPNIKGAYHSEAMWRAVEAALACIEQFSTYRPNMVDIVRELEDALIIENNASEYMRSIESFGGSNRYLSIERKITADTSSQNYYEIPRLVLKKLGDANPDMNINVEDLISTIMSSENENLTGGISS